MALPSILMAAILSNMVARDGSEEDVFVKSRLLKNLSRMSVSSHMTRPIADAKNIHSNTPAIEVLIFAQP